MKEKTLKDASPFYAGKLAFLYCSWNRFVWCKIFSHHEITESDWAILGVEEDKQNIPLDSKRPVWFYCSRCTLVLLTLPLEECSVLTKWQIAKTVRVANGRPWFYR